MFFLRHSVHVERYRGDLRASSRNFSAVSYSSSNLHVFTATSVLSPPFCTYNNDNDNDNDKSTNTQRLACSMFCVYLPGDTPSRLSTKTAYKYISNVYCIIIISECLRAICRARIYPSKIRSWFIRKLSRYVGPHSV